MGPTGRSLAWPSARLVALVAFLGGVLGPTFDQIHVQLGVLSYPHPDVLDQPWWVFPQFAFAALVMVLPYRAALPLMPPRENAQGSLRAVLVTLAVFVGFYFGTSLLNRWEWPLLAAYVVVFALRVPREGGAWGLGHAVLCAVGGTAWEASLCALGFFQYDVSKSLLGVPAWLPGLYLHAALFLRAMARFVAEPPPALSTADTPSGRPADRMIA